MDDEIILKISIILNHSKSFAEKSSHLRSSFTSNTVYFCQSCKINEEKLLIIQDHINM